VFPAPCPAAAHRARTVLPGSTCRPQVLREPLPLPDDVVSVLGIPRRCHLSADDPTQHLQSEALKKIRWEEGMKIRKGELSLLQVKRWARCNTWNHIGGCTKKDELKTEAIGGIMHG